MSRQLERIVVGVILMFVSAVLFVHLANDQPATERAVAAALAAVTPEPTPEPTPTPVPTPIPTPWLVAPESCVAALDAANQMIRFSANLILEILNAYLDHPGEGMAAFGERVKTILLANPIDTVTSDLYFAQAATCRLTAE